MADSNSTPSSTRTRAAWKPGVADEPVPFYGSAGCGAVLMGVLKNSFVLLQVSAYWQIIVLGVVIIAAVAGDSIRTRRSER